MREWEGGTKWQGGWRADNGGSELGGLNMAGQQDRRRLAVAVKKMGGDQERKACFRLW